MSGYSHLPLPTARTLSTAEERREEILEAAGHVFAARGTLLNEASPARRSATASGAKRGMALGICALPLAGSCGRRCARRRRCCRWFFRSRAFAASNAVSFAMFFGVFGSIFLLVFVPGIRARRAPASATPAPEVLATAPAAR